jgi:hypothetical protein
MSRGIDVLSLIKSFAARNGLAVLEYKTFAQAIQRQARLSDQSEPLYRDLTLNPDMILVPKLYMLAKERKIALETVGNEIKAIVLPGHFDDVFRREYRKIDDNPDIPFPDEESLRLSVPDDWIQTVSIDADLGPVSEGKGRREVPLFRISFPEGLKPFVIPSEFVPDKLLEYSMIKLRQYLRKGANKEFMFNKLSGAFPGKENLLKDCLADILSKPYEAIEDMKSSTSDFTYPFWAYFISALKKDLEKKKDKSAEDVSTHQAACICEFYANFYKGKAQRLIDLESTLKAIDAGIRKPPYNFTIDEILSFRDAKGAPVLSKFSREELEAKIREKSTKAEPGKLPELILISTGGRRAYVAKDRALLLAVRQISEARSDIRARLIDQWHSLLEEFRSCPAMDDDAAFIGELTLQVQSRFPILDALIRDRLLPLIRDEVASRTELPPDVTRLFYKDDLIPIDELLDLSRKSLLTDAKMILPFWYSIPIVSTIARLVKRISRYRAEKAAARYPLSREAAAARSKTASKIRTPTAKERRAEFEAAATRIAKELLPPGRGLEEYLRELENRWNTMLSAEAKRNLSFDVDSLVRDYLRNVVRSMGGTAFTVERVRNLASSLADSPALLKIKNHQALEQYIQLYMTKILGARVEPELH